jgi:hypothetical protein
LAIDRSANASAYNKSGITASEIFAGQTPPPPPAAQRFLERLAEATRTTVRAAAASDAPAPGASPPSDAPPAAEPARTYPLEDGKKQSP